MASGSYAQNFNNQQSNFNNQPIDFNNQNQQGGFGYNQSNTNNTIEEEEDTNSVAKVKEAFKLKHNPVLASLISSVIPGGGQIYNGKYWKVPIFWGLMGTFTFFTINNNKRYQDFRSAYAYTVLRDPNDFNRELEPEEALIGYNNIYEKYSNELRILNENSDIRLVQNRVEFLRDDARRTRDWMAVFLIITYVCNILDASVDAHFYGIDMSDNISMKIKPQLLNPYGVPQLGLNLNFTFHESKIKKTHF
jgi:hypothetical protein